MGLKPVSDLGDGFRFYFYPFPVKTNALFIFRNVFFIESKATPRQMSVEQMLPADPLISVILSGLQQDGSTKIRIEPGLFEWTKWVSGTGLPTWIPPAELAAVSLSVDTAYRYAEARLDLPHTLKCFRARARSCQILSVSFPDLTFP